MKNKPINKIEPIPRMKGQVKPVDTSIYKSAYQDVEYWESNGMVAHSIEGKITILRAKLNELIEVVNSLNQ